MAKLNRGKFTRADHRGYRRNRTRYESRRRLLRPTSQISERTDANNKDLSDFEENASHDFIVDVGRQAATNAINENKAMNIPVTFLKDGWVVRRMPKGNIEKVIKVDSQTGIVRQRKLTKGTVLHVKRPH